MALYDVRAVWDSLRGLVGGTYGVNDLSGVCSIEDVYMMVAITANQAIAAKELEK